MSSPTTTRLSVLPVFGEARRECLNDATLVTRPDAESDACLISRIQAGERDALSIVFRRYAGAIHSIGRRILGDKSEAEDLVQEVFLYVYRRSRLFDNSKGSARSWIFQIAYTQAFIRRRKLKAHGFYASGIADTSSKVEPGNGWGANYEHTVEGLFGRNGWRKILESLTEEQLETLRLHFFEGYTFAEIAKKLGQSHANVRNHHYRGLEKIRKKLAEDELNRR